MPDQQIAEITMNPYCNDSGVFVGFMHNKARPDLSGCCQELYVELFVKF